MQTLASYTFLEKKIRVCFCENMTFRNISVGVLVLAERIIFRKYIHMFSLELSLFRV